MNLKELYLKGRKDKDDSIAHLLQTPAFLTSLSSAAESLGYRPGGGASVYSGGIVLDPYAIDALNYWIQNTQSSMFYFTVEENGYTGLKQLILNTRGRE